MKNKKSITLSAHVKPERYRLMVHPNMEDFTFKCEETIYLKISKASREIVLHGVDLKVTEAVLASGGNEYVPKIIYKSLKETVVFSF